MNTLYYSTSLQAITACKKSFRPPDISIQNKRLQSEEIATKTLYFLASGGVIKKEASFKKPFKKPFKKIIKFITKIVPSPVAKPKFKIEKTKKKASPNVRLKSLLPGTLLPLAGRRRLIKAGITKPGKAWTWVPGHPDIIKVKSIFASK